MPCGDDASFVGFAGEGRQLGSCGFRREIPPGCLVSAVPTLPARHGKNGEDYVARMRKGFLLEWTVVSGDCSSCIASGGECMYPDNGLGFSCNCPDGIHYPFICGEYMKV